MAGRESGKVHFDALAGGRAAVRRRGHRGMSTAHGCFCLNLYILCWNLSEFHANRDDCFDELRHKF